MSRTPKDLQIKPRDYAFGRGLARERWWLGGDPVASAIFDALSATFPQGERFFMDSLRRYKDQAPPELQAQIAAFITQEALHTREHVAFNRHIVAQGRDLAAMEARSKALLDEARERPDYIQLCATVAMEHFTAIFAHLILSDPRLLRGADPEIARLWRWHGLEEIEHKAVAYDVMNHVLRGARPRKRWMLRCAVMIDTTRLFVGAIRANIAQILREDGLDPARARRALARYFLLSPGCLWRVLPLYFAFFLPGFHPWKHDDRALLQRVEGEIAPA
jgi:predicted metal-dependent hydrolase